MATTDHSTPARTCCDCSKPLTGHNTPLRCKPCAARARYIAKHGHPPVRLIATCETCTKEFEDYATNRTKHTHGVFFCSPACRTAWVGVHNSISRGGDGLQRSKADKDALDYRKHAEPRRINARTWYEKNRDMVLRARQKADRALKQELVDAYGGACVCCGETRIEFLTIDHINGGGSEHRRRVGKGRKIYQELKKLGFPKDEYQLLCFNCNIVLGFYGYCPHRPEEKREVNHVPRKPGRPRTVA